MILVTVGMQLGFDRLVEAMDELTPSLTEPVVAQVGKSAFRPRNMEAREKIAPADFESLILRSKLVVSHAGIGTVLTAQRFAKPIVLVPRRADLGEHRNDHQLATAEKLGGRPGILVASDESELQARIEQALAMEQWSSQQSPTAQQLHAAIANFIETGAL